MADDDVEQPQTAVAETESNSPAETEQETEGEEQAEEQETEAESEAAEGDESDEEPEPKPKKESRSARYQRQIERLRTENAELLARLRPVSDISPEAELEKIVGKPPKEEDFKGDYLAFERAVTAYEVHKRIASQQVNTERERAAQRAAEVRGALIQDHNDRMDDLREATKDFDEVMRKASDIKVSPTVEDLILESDNSARIAYYLAKNPSEATRLNALTERQAAKAIGAIEERLSRPAEPKKQTTAPKPIAPVKGRGTTPFNPATASTEQYIKMRNSGWQG